MSKITPHLWFDTQAVEAAELYSSTFPGSRVTDVTTLHDTPSGDCDVVSFELCGQPFMAISAGPLFEFTPAISFLVRCQTTEEVDRLWKTLSDGGNALMPLDSYPFSDRYGWTEDRYGLSWQVMYAGEDAARQRIVPTLMFAGDVCGRAEEAVSFYTSVFRDAAPGDVFRYAKGEEPDREGTIKYAAFTLEGQEFAAMDSARVSDVGFNEAISLMVGCETQDEIDYYWEKLSSVPEAEQCGWLKDRFGVSWQITPSILGELLGGSGEQTARVTQAFLQMKKFDVAELERAYAGASVSSTSGTGSPSGG
ncbi:MAG TPA: VOC family protein [Actinomycetota bacterium]|nr:VOC family protein [Actinomycetota bacterium]